MSAVVDLSIFDQFSGILFASAGDDILDFSREYEFITAGPGYDTVKFPFFSRDVTIGDNSVTFDAKVLRDLFHDTPDPYPNTIISLRLPGSFVQTLNKVERIEFLDKAIVLADRLKDTGNPQSTGNGASASFATSSKGPFVLEPTQDPVTGQSLFTVPEGTPAVLKKRISDEDYSWGSEAIKLKNGKKTTFFLVDNDFAIIEAFEPDDILSTPDDLFEYEIVPAPFIDGSAIVLDQRDRTNVLALINDPNGFFV